MIWEITSDLVNGTNALLPGVFEECYRSGVRKEISKIQISAEANKVPVTPPKHRRAVPVKKAFHLRKSLDGE